VTTGERRLHIRTMTRPNLWSWLSVAEQVLGQMAEWAW
jgi:hypothetical protein